MAPDSMTWTPPVSFCFSVEFQWTDNSRSSASFAEVEGLGQEIVLSDSASRAEMLPGFPTEVKVPNITLKRSLEPLSEPISRWLDRSFHFLDCGWIEPCKLVVCLLDKEGGATAAWVCMQAVPLKWTLYPLNASDSKLAIETLTLRYTRLIRSK